MNASVLDETRRIVVREVPAPEAFAKFHAQQDGFIKIVREPS